MKFNVVSLMPEMVEQSLEFGVVGSAFKKGICLLETINPRQFTSDNHQTVDDRPFGGGDGMLMMAEPLQKTLNNLQPSGPVYFLSPQGKVFDDKMSLDWSKLDEITLICGRYGGVDERFLQKNQIEEVSLGDFVMSGGEPAAIAMIDSTVRKIPGVLGHVSSASEDSFANGALEVPHFTRPQEWEGMSVPPILLSGDHKKIQEYKMHMGWVITLSKRPELLQKIRPPWDQTLAYVEGLSAENMIPLGLDKEKVLQALAHLGGYQDV